MAETSFDAVAGSLNSKEVTNGNVVTGHVYMIYMSESTIDKEKFEVIYNPADNNGVQNFGIILDNGSNLYGCTAEIALANGTISLRNAVRCGLHESGRASWNVSIQKIYMIA